jgi:undecaprenyl diphosphate synthase
MKNIRHVGIIMDGNGRWAQKRGLPRTAGHRQGLDAAKAIVKAAREQGIPYLTLYTFSTENWKRSAEEVSFLMNLIRTGLRREYDFYRANGIRVLHSGDLGALPDDIRREIEAVEIDTRCFSGLTVNLAINYGGRDEILRAMQGALNDGVQPGDLDEIQIQRYLDQPQIPDLDLIIRTGGEQRLSNFMLWRCSYAELYFSDCLWPDFGSAELMEVLHWYDRRQRRFGAIPEAAGV